MAPGYISALDADAYVRPRLDVAVSFSPDGRSRVLWRGKPLAKALVTAHHRMAADQGKVHTLTARTDAGGRVTFPVQAAGAWLLRMVHMVPCRGCSHTDWESYWTSFSFAVD